MWAWVGCTGNIALVPPTARITLPRGRLIRPQWLSRSAPAVSRHHHPCLHRVGDLATPKGIGLSTDWSTTAVATWVRIDCSMRVVQSAWAESEGARRTATRGRRGRSHGSLPVTVSLASFGGCPCHARCLGHSRVRAIAGCGHVALSVVSPGWRQRQGIRRGPGQHSAWPSGTPRRLARVSRFYH